MPNFSFLGCLEVVVLWLETKTRPQDSVELEASLAPAEAEVGDLAKADQMEEDRNILKPIRPIVLFLLKATCGYSNRVRFVCEKCGGMSLTRIYYILLGVNVFSYNNNSEVLDYK
jgi:hypothetical protein